MYIGIDVGHTNIKARAFDSNWDIVGKADVAAGMVHPSDDRTEIPIRERWEIVLDCLDTLETQVHPEDGFEGIGLAGGGGGFYPLDETKEPFMNGITLLDERAKDIYDRWNADGTYEQICQITGTPSPPGAALLVFRWLKENEPELYEKTEYLLNHKDAIRYRLTDELAMEPTDATFSFTNHRTQAFDDTLFELTGISEKRHVLPELLDSSYDIAGYTTQDVERETGIAEGTPVVAGAHDACANTLGVGAVEENVVTTTGGTWSFSTLVSDEANVQLDQWCCENFVERGQWMYQIANPTGTLSLNWFVDEFCEPERREAEATETNVWDVIETKIEDVETNVIFHPYIAGNPYGYLFDQDATGSFTGIQQSSGRADLLRAVYEAIAFMHRWQIDLFDDAFDFDEVRFTGGAARSEYWARMFADVMNKPVSTTAINESGCFGAAMLAAIGTGHLSGIEATAELVEIEDVYYPSETDYEQNYQDFKRLSGLLEPVWDAHPASRD